MNSPWVPNAWVTVGGRVLSEKQIRYVGTESQLAALITTTQIIVRLMTCN